MAGMGRGRGGRQLWECVCECVEAPQQQTCRPCVSPLCFTHQWAVLPATECPACGRFPLPLRAGLPVAVSRPFPALRVHGALSPQALCSGVLSDLCAGPAIPLHTLHLALPDPRESGPGPWHDASRKLLRSQLPWPFISVLLMPQRGTVALGLVAHPCK